MANIATGITTLSVGAQVVPAYPNGFQGPLFLLNTGANPVYVSDATSFGPTSGIPLNPGANLAWDPGRPLFFICAAGLPTTVIVALNSGALNDPTVLATALIDAGLAQDIADDIALKGAPPINSFDTIANLAASAYPFVSGVIDCSKYQSLDLIAFETAFSGLGVPPIPRSITLNWDNGLVDTFYITDAKGSIAIGAFGHFQVPVRAATVTVVVGSNSRVTATTTAVEIVGSYRTQSGTAYKQISAYWGSSGVGAVFGDGTDNYAAWNLAKGAAIVNEYPPTVAGDVSLWVSTNVIAGTGNFSVLVLDLVSQLQLAQITVNNGAIGNQGTYFKATNRPIQLQLTPAAATCSAVHISLAANGT